MRGILNTAGKIKKIESANKYSDWFRCFKLGDIKVEERVIERNFDQYLLRNYVTVWRHSG